MKLLKIISLLLIGSSAQAAIALVNVSSNTGNGGATSIATPATSLTAGNLLVACVRFANSGPVTVALTNTAGDTFNLIRTTRTAANDQMDLYYVKNSTGNALNITTATFSGDLAAFRSIANLQYSGIDISSPLDAVASGSATATTATTGLFTTTQADEVIVACSQVTELGATWTPDTGFTNEVQDASHILMVQDKIVSSIQTNTTVTASAGSSAVLIISASFKATVPPVILKTFTGGGMISGGGTIQ